MEAFLSWLSNERGVLVSTLRQALSAVLFLYEQVLGQQLPWMVIEDMSPQGHYVLLLYIANHPREAVDDGCISAVVLKQAADHLKMVVEHGPATRVQEARAVDTTSAHCRADA